MMNPIMAIAALAVLGGFLGILLWHVPEPDLIIITVAVMLMAAFDLLRSLIGRK